MDEKIIRILILIVMFVIFYFLVNYITSSYNNLFHSNANAKNEDIVKLLVDNIGEQQKLKAELEQIKTGTTPLVAVPPTLPVDILSEYDRQKLLDPLTDARGRTSADQIPIPELALGFNYPTQGYPDLYRRVGLLIATDGHTHHDYDRNRDYDHHKDFDKEEKKLPHRTPKEEIKKTGKLRTNFRSSIPKFKQVREGFNSDDSDNNILELIGKKINSNWFKYFTSITKGNKIIKINLDQNNKRELLDGDEVYISELGRRYKVQLDELDMIQYNPYYV